MDTPKEQPATMAEVSANNNANNNTTMTPKGESTDSSSAVGVSQSTLNTIVDYIRAKLPIPEKLLKEFGPGDGLAQFILQKRKEVEEMDQNKELINNAKETLLVERKLEDDEKLRGKSDVDQDAQGKYFTKVTVPPALLRKFPVFSGVYAAEAVPIQSTVSLDTLRMREMMVALARVVTGVHIHFLEFGGHYWGHTKDLTKDVVTTDHPFFDFYDKDGVYMFPIKQGLVPKNDIPGMPFCGSVSNLPGILILDVASLKIDFLVMVGKVSVPSFIMRYTGSGWICRETKNLEITNIVGVGFYITRGQFSLKSVNSAGALIFQKKGISTVEHELHYMARYDSVSISFPDFKMTYNLPLSLTNYAFGGEIVRIYEWANKDTKRIPFWSYRCRIKLDLLAPNGKEFVEHFDQQKQISIYRRNPIKDLVNATSTYAYNLGAFMLDSPWALLSLVLSAAFFTIYGMTWFILSPWILFSRRALFFAEPQIQWIKDIPHNIIAWFVTNKITKKLYDYRRMITALLIAVLFVVLWQFKWTRTGHTKPKKKMETETKQALLDGMEKFFGASLIAGGVGLIFSTSADLFLQIAKDMEWLDGDMIDKGLLTKVNKYVRLISAVFGALGLLSLRTRSYHTGEDKEKQDVKQDEIEVVEQYELLTSKFKKAFKNTKTRFGDFTNDAKDRVRSFWKDYIVTNKYTVIFMVIFCLMIMVIFYYRSHRAKKAETAKRYYNDEMKQILGVDMKEAAVLYMENQLNEYIDMFRKSNDNDQKEKLKAKIMSIAEYLQIDQGEMLDAMTGISSKVKIDHAGTAAHLKAKNLEKAESYAQTILKMPTSRKAIVFDKNLMNYPITHVIYEKEGQWHVAKYAPREIGEEQKILNFNEQPLGNLKWGDSPETEENSQKHLDVNEAIRKHKPVYARVYSPQQGKFLKEKFMVVEDENVTFDNSINWKVKTDNNNNNVVPPKKFENRKIIQQNLGKIEEYEKEERDRWLQESKENYKKKHTTNVLVEPIVESKEEITERTNHTAIDLKIFDRSMGEIFNGQTWGVWYCTEGKVVTAAHVLKPNKKLVPSVKFYNLDGVECVVDTKHFTFEPNVPLGNTDDIDDCWVDANKVRFGQLTPKNLPRGKRFFVNTVFIPLIRNNKIVLATGSATMFPRRIMDDIKHTINEAIPGDSGAPILDKEFKVIGTHSGDYTGQRVGISLPTFEIKEENVNQQIFSKQLQNANLKVNILKMEHNESIVDPVGPNIEKTVHTVVRPRKEINFGQYPPEVHIDKDSFGPFVENDFYNEYIKPYEHNLEKIGNLAWASNHGRTKLQKNEIICEKMRELGLPDMSKTYGVTVPTVLSNYKDSRKYFLDYPFSPKFKEMHEAYRMLVEIFQPILFGFRFLTIEEAIDRLDGSKAPGGRWKKKYMSKKQVLDNHLDFLKKLIQIFFETGDFPTPLISAADKEEIRELLKILEHKIRVYAPFDTEHCILHTMLYGHLMDVLSSSDMRQTHIFVGNSPFYGGYNKMYKWLNETSDDGFGYFESDQVKYDAHIRNVQRMNMVKYFYAEMCETEEQKQYLILAEEAVLQPLFVFSDGNVVRMLQSARFSGEPMTLHGNSIQMIHLLYYCLLRHGLTKQEIYDCVNFMTLGDDNIWSMSAKTGLPIFTSEIFEILGKELGFESDPGVSKARHFMQSSFCGTRPIQLQDGYIVFVPDIDKQLFSLQIYQKKSTSFDIMMKMIALYSYMIWTEYRQPLFELCYWWYKNHDTDQQIKELWATSDLKTMHRMYYPAYHTSGGPLNLIEPIKFETTKMNFAYDGNNCGPGYNSGKNKSFDSESPTTPKHVTDAACFEHDAVYATARSERELSEADRKLAKVALSEWRLDIALPIYLQSILRDLNLLPSFLSSLNKDNTNTPQFTDWMTKNKGKNAKNIKKKLKKASKRRARPLSLSAWRRRAPKPTAERRLVKAVEKRIDQRNVPITAPPTVTKNNRKMRTKENGNRLCIEDATYFGTISNSASAVVGTIQNNRVIKPSVLSPYFTAQIGKMYQKCRIKSHLLMKCIAPSTIGGSCFVGFDPDVSDSYQTGQVISPNEMLVSSQKNYFQIISDFSMTQKKVLQQDWRDIWTTTPQENFEINMRGAGQYFIGNNAKSLSTADVYEVWIVYKIEFYKRFSEFQVDYAFLTGPNPSNTVVFGPMENNATTGIALAGSTDQEITFSATIPGDYFLFYGASHSSSTAVATNPVVFGHTGGGTVLFGYDLKAIDAAISGGRKNVSWWGAIRIKPGDAACNIVIAPHASEFADDAAFENVDVYVVRNQTIPGNGNYPDPQLVPQKQVGNKDIKREILALFDDDDDLLEKLLVKNKAKVRLRKFLKMATQTGRYPSWALDPAIWNSKEIPERYEEFLIILELKRSNSKQEIDDINLSD